MFAPKWMVLRLMAVALLMTGAVGVAKAQLEGLVITEIMANPVGSDSFYEWFEVVNTSASTIDLENWYVDEVDGFIRFDFGPTILAANNPGVNPLDNGLSGMTLLPGQVGVIYDGFNFNPFNHDEQAFRDTWNVPANAAVISMDFAPSLNNGGDTIAFYETIADLEADALDPVAFNAGGTTLANFNNAALTLPYEDGTNGWPATTSGFSVEISDTSADASVGSNWTLSVDGVRGASVSNALIDNSGVGTINDTDDFGSPGQIQNLGTPPSGLHFTEIMYNPASPEPAWEWVEVYNNTGSAIDFGANPGVFDDDDNDDFAGPNLTSGVIPDGSVAVIFNAADNTLQNMIDAWDPGGALGVNLIPATEFTSFTQGGDGLAIWSSFADYTGETTTGQGRSFDNALTSIDYENNDDAWPDDNGTSSVYLEDVTNAGLPGTIDGDFSGNGTVDAADYTIWRDNLGTTSGALPSDGDADGDGDVDTDDYDIWVANFGGVATGGSFWALSGSDIFDFDSRPAVGIPAVGGVVIAEGGNVASPGVFIAAGPSAAIPEPSAALLLLAGVAGLASVRRNG